jgi:hypothetical protein
MVYFAGVPSIAVRRRCFPRALAVWLLVVFGAILLHWLYAQSREGHAHDRTHHPHCALCLLMHGHVVLADSLSPLSAVVWRVGESSREMGWPFRDWGTLAAPTRGPPAA